MAKKSHVGKAIVFTSLFALTLGVGIVLVVEDMLGVPYTAPPQPSMELSDLINLLNNNSTLEFITKLLQENPDLAEWIANWILDNFDVSELSTEDLQTLIETFPGMEQYLGELLLEQLLEGGELYNPPEPGLSPSISGGGSIDNGDLDLSGPDYPLFSVSSPNSRGTVYLRSCSWGDYDPFQRKFLDAPAFDGSTYLISPAFFASYCAMSSATSSKTITFYMDGHRDYGTIVPDVPEVYCTSSELVGGYYYFSPDAENRAWKIDADEYSMNYYPDFDAERASSSSNETFVENEKRYRRYARRNYLNVDESQKEYLLTFLNENHLNTPAQVVDYLRKNYTYADRSMDCPVGEDIVSYFLFEHKEGTCTNFASAATLLCRMLDTPTRYVTGYYHSGLKQTPTEVTTHEAHAWIEIYVDGIGWKRMEPTAQSIKELSSTEAADGRMGVSFGGNNPSQPILTYSTDAIGEDIYLRSFSYGDYLPSEKAFSAEILNQPDESSLLSLANLMPDDNAKVINISYGEGFTPLGMLEASYGFGSYSYSEFSSSNAYVPSDPFTPYNDQRFANLANEYSQLFDPTMDFSRIYRRNSDAAYNAYANATYTSVPDSLMGSLVSYLGTTGVRTPKDICAFLKDHHALDENYRASEPISDLLSGDHIGDMKTFSAALTLLCRASGYPARYVEGYFIDGETNVGAGSLTRKNGRCWVEVYQQGIGWERFDPLPEAKAVWDGNMDFSTQDVFIQYDGKTHVADENSIVLPAGLENHLTNNGERLEIEFTALTLKGIKDVGFSPIRIKSIHIYDFWGNDITSSYPAINITNDGKLHIEPRPFAITSNSGETQLNYEPFRSLTFNSDELAEGQVFDDSELVWEEIPLSSPGVHDNVFSGWKIVDEEGNDVSSNYQTTITYGKIEVK